MVTTLKTTTKSVSIVSFETSYALRSSFQRASFEDSSCLALVVLNSS